MSEALGLISSRPIFRELPDEKQKLKREVLQESIIESVSDSERLHSVIQKINEKRSSFGNLSIEGVEIVNVQLSEHLTLADLRATEGNPLQEKLIEILQLKNSIEKINKHFPFFERLKKVSYDVLDRVSLLSLQLIQLKKDLKRTEVIDALIDEEAFIDISVQTLLDRRDLKVFTFRMNQIYQQRPDLLTKISRTPFNKPWFWQSLQVSAAKLRLLSSEDILAIRHKLPTKAFGLLTDDQLKLLDFSILFPDQIVSCIRGGIDDQETIQRRFSSLSQQQLFIIFRKVDSDILSHFPVTSFRKLPFGALTKKQINSLFCDFRIPEIEREQRITMLPSEAINAMLPKLESAFLLNLSDAQIRGLDYSKVSKKNVEDIFCRWKFRDSEKCRRIALIPSQSIGLLMKVAEGDFLSRLTQEHILSLDLDSMNREQIENVFFNWHLNPCQKQDKIRILPAQTINKMIHYGFLDVLKYISSQQLAQIDLKNVPQEFIETLFPPLDPSKFFPGYCYSVKIDSRGRRQYNYEYKSDIGSGRKSMSDEVMQDQIEQRKAKCRENFQILSQQQFEGIKGKLNSEVLSFLS